MMTSEEAFVKLKALDPEGHVETAWLVADWDSSGVLEEEILSLKGPALEMAVQELRTRLELDDPAPEEVRSLLRRVTTMLQDESLVLSGGAVVGCGCLHTSRFS